MPRTPNIALITKASPSGWTARNMRSSSSATTPSGIPGSFPRSSTFRLDPNVPYECQPSSTNSFKTDAPGALTYERGHQVPANHLDYSELAIRQSNYMTNILPQTQTLNSGRVAAERGNHRVLSGHRGITGARRGAVEEHQGGPEERSLRGFAQHPDA